MASRVEEEAGDSTREAFLREQRQMFEGGFSFSGFERDLVALNLGDGRFLDISGVTGADSVGDGRAAVYADFDNDGDLDLFLRSMHGPAHLLFRNEVGQDNRSVRVALRGTTSGRDAFGAVVRISTAAGTQTQVKSGGSGYLSQSDPRLLFGLGASDGSDWLEVAWPSGHRQRFAGPRAGQSILVVEGEETVRPVSERRFSLPDPLSASERAWKGVRVKRGDRLPALALETLDGKRSDLASLAAAGQRTLVNFWATWCAPCAVEMPELQHLADSGLRVVGVSLDAPGDRSRIPAFLARLGVAYPIHLAPREGLETLFAGSNISIPLSIVLDAEGRVEDVVSGWSPETKRRLEALVPGR